MMTLKWTKQLSVGNAVIDSDHKNLIGVVNDTRSAIRARDSFMLSEAFVRLEDWLWIHFENEEIQFNAELYNQSYELVNEPEITIDITEENGDKYNFVFSRTSNAYLLNAGILPAGFYNYKAKVKLSDKELVATGKFQVKRLLLEANNTVADHQLLQNIAQKFGGKMFAPQQIDNLLKAINDNSNITSIIYEENDLKELISLKWIFFVLLSLLSLEWFFRKRNGAY